MKHFLSCFSKIRTLLFALVDNELSIGKCLLKLNELDLQQNLALILLLQSLQILQKNTRRFLSICENIKTVKLWNKIDLLIIFYSHY